MAKPRLEPQTAGLPNPGFVRSATLLYPGTAGSCRRLFRGAIRFDLYFQQITAACDIQGTGPEDWETGSLLRSQLRMVVAGARVVLGVRVEAERNGWG